MGSPSPRLLPVIERDDVVVIGGDDDGSMRTAPLGVLSGAVGGLGDGIVAAVMQWWSRWWESGSV